MSVRYVRPRSRSAAWSRRLALFALLLVVVAVLLHRGGGLSTASLVAIFAIAVALAALGLALAALGLWRLWHAGAKGGRAAVAGALAAGLVLAPAVYGLSAWLRYPALSDIATDVEDVPAWLEPPSGAFWPVPGGASARRGAGEGPPPAALALQRAAYPGVTGRRYDGALDRVLPAVRAAIDSQRLTIVAEEGVETVLAPADENGTAAPSAAGEGEAAAPADAAGGEGVPAERVPLPIRRPRAVVPDAALAAPVDVRIQAVWRTPVLGLPSDVVIRLSEEADATVVDLRIAARYGGHDLGSGAAFARRFFAALDRRLMGMAGG